MGTSGSEFETGTFRLLVFVIVGSGESLLVSVGRRSKTLVP